jgi:hypothetical protein
VARKKTAKNLRTVKESLSRRLREIRQELFGKHGGPELARRLGLPARTWYNYETGGTVPAEVLLRFIELTGVNPRWLAHGVGPKYRDRPEDRLISETTPAELIRRGLEELERSARMIRWLDVHGRHLILRPNHNVGRDYPLIPVELDSPGTMIIGQVVWSRSRFGPE